MKKPKKIKFLSSMAIILTIINFNAYANETKEKDSPVIQVLSVAVGDWNEDKHTDSAVLMRTDERVELYIYLANEENKQEQVFHKNDVVWSGIMAGSEPYLETKKNRASLLIHSLNDSIGRNRWHQILTITYRDKTFVVAGYTFHDRDTLDIDNNNDCDVNLVTGKGIKNKKEFSIKAQKIKLEDWTEENSPKQCQSEDR